MLNFGKIRQETKHICFDVPDTTVPDVTIPSVNIEKLKGPQLPDISSGILSFGKKVISEINNLESQLEKLRLGFPVKNKLSFGLPSLNDFTSKLQSLKVPTTICITVGGSNVGLDAVFDQVNTAIDSLTKPKITLPIPDFSNLPFIPISNIVPALNILPIVPIEKSADQILSEIKDRCAQLLLNELDNLDPLVRLEQLIQKFQELCGLLRFSQLQSVIEQIQRAKADLVRKVIDGITDPAAKIAKLYDMAVDAVNSGAQDIVNEISNLIDRIKFDSLIDQILQMNPRDAIASLSDEIKRQAQLKNFSAIRQLLTAINIVKNQLVDLTNTVFDVPVTAVDSIQDKINELVDLQNYEGIEKLLTAYDTVQDAVLRQLSELDPEHLLQEGRNLLNAALQKMDIGLYNRILSEMAAKICNSGADLLPNLPNVPEVNPDSVPNFLK